MRFFVLLVLVLSLFGCNKSVVRNKSVYREELNFIDAASDETVMNGKALIASMCECSEIEGVKGFTTAECRNLAETVLVVEARVKYHTNMMRFNSGLIEERPSEDPPEVPETNTLCP
jgi:hypothetical protein